MRALDLHLYMECMNEYMGRLVGGGHVSNRTLSNRVYSFSLSVAPFRSSSSPRRSMSVVCVLLFRTAPDMDSPICVV